MHIENPFEKRALEDYLKAIYRLEEVFGTVRTNDIAQELGVSPSTVSKTLRKLAKDGYIIWDPYIGVKLSDKGRDMALTIVRKHRIAETFLYRILKFDIVKAHSYAHAMEHLPEEIFDKLYEFLGKPTRCPHGNPIEPQKFVDIGDKSITLFEPNTKVIITRISCSFKRDLMVKLYELGMNIDKEMCILEKGSGYIRILIDGRGVILTTYEATFIKGVERGRCG
ncbi:iron (metal) dependent repressor, DtxR family [Ignisphaera aggregans DSM 17230]|uniref:Iron (Metal) dependent repressor, DtxR family n=1 Tax=Ignisphaera aggregans (strain DSM 17230 / JCM 13409 / AQ1.S1) TaxID=583356 RepID=E0SPQ1_IGNAA|nr:iron (metal) dependent repressor, DtxR family [Ignisphaera aggregans DSM 17230]